VSSFAKEYNKSVFQINNKEVLPMLFKKKKKRFGVK